MCQAKPGLRCARHAQEKLAKAQSAYQEAVECRDPQGIAAARQELETAQLEFDLTPDSLIGVNNTDRGTQLASIVQNRKDAVRKIKDAYSYDSTACTKKRQLVADYENQLYDFGRAHSSAQDYDETIADIGVALEQTQKRLRTAQINDTSLRERITDAINAGQQVPDTLWIRASYESMAVKVHKEHLGNLKNALAHAEDIKRDHAPDTVNSGDLAAIHPEELVGSLEEASPSRGYQDYWLKDDEGNNVAFVRTLAHKGHEGYLDGKPYVVLCDIEVRGEHRGKGYARAIVEQIQHRLDQPLYASGTFTAAGSQRISHLVRQLPGNRVSSTDDMRFVHNWDEQIPKYW